MRIGIVGGSGKQGTGLALRWKRAGHSVVIGSRDPARARAHVASLPPDAPLRAAALDVGDYAWATRESDVVVLTVPYEAHAETLQAVGPHAAGKIVVDVTVPLRPPKVSRVHLPPGQAAALESQVALGTAAPVVAALHHVSSSHLADLAHAIDCDVLVAADDKNAKETVLGLMRDLGTRGLDAGPLVNAIALEALTPVLIHLNKVYKSEGAGIVFTDLPGAPPRT
jgi:NADPH-dependent F420 reductase